jgi:exonuclease SbcD
VGGAVLSGSERRVQVGDNYATQLEHLPAVTYAAFGHIHKPQDLPGSVVIGCYAGSPIQLDFGELDEAKRIVLVDARPGYPPEIQSLPLSGGRPLWRFEGTMEELATAASGVGRALALATIYSPSTIADLHSRVQDLLPDAVVLDVYPVAADRQLEVAVAAVPSGPEPGIEELFRDYLAEQGTKGAAADLVMATFSRLLEAIETEQEAYFPEEGFISAGPQSPS